MSETKHTPGPWRVEVSEGYPSPVAEYIVFAREGAVTWIDGLPSPTKAANARLIAAAPDLLAACRAVEHAFAVGEASDGFGIAMDAAAKLVHAAIARAEGRNE